MSQGSRRANSLAPTPVLPRTGYRLVIACVLGLSAGATLGQTAPAPVPPGEVAASSDLEPLRDVLGRLKQELEALKRQLLSQAEETVAATARLTADKETLAKDLTETKKALGQAEAEREKLAREVADLRAAQEKILAEAQSVRDDLENRVLVAEGKAAAAERSAEDRLAGAEKATADKLASAARDLEALRVRISDLAKEREREAHARAAAEQQVSALQRHVTELQAQIAAGETERKDLHDALAAAKAKLPTGSGGTLSLDEARARASAAAAAYVEAAREAKIKPSDTTRASAQEAAARLRAAQFDVAQGTDAQGVYPMRREDTLAVVASRFYGKANRWPSIFEANRHVLTSPDQVLPGITLVVP